MDKLSAFFVGVVDFFAALLPGTATIGVILYYANARDVTELRALASSETMTIGALLVAGYIVGQVMNAIGGYLLDWIYDIFYDPERGVLVNETRTDGHPAWRFMTAAWSKYGSQHKNDLKTEIDGIASSKSGNVYQRIRGYLSHMAPAGFAQVESLEAEQKFFRTSTIACIAIAFYSGLVPWAIAGAFLLTRYIKLRRKTIERAYMLFSFRALVPPAPPVKS